MITKHNSILLIDCEVVEKEVRAKKEKLNEEADEKTEEITVTQEEVYLSVKNKLNNNTSSSSIIYNLPKSVSAEVEYTKFKEIVNKSPGSVI